MWDEGRCWNVCRCREAPSGEAFRCMGCGGGLLWKHAVLIVERILASHRLEPRVSRL